MIGGTDIAAEIRAIHFRDLAFAAELAALKFFRHGFADLVQQDPASLVRHAQIAGQRESVLALDFVHEDGDSGEISRSGALWAANSVPEVMVKSLRQALQRKRRRPLGRRAL